MRKKTVLGIFLVLLMILGGIGYIAIRNQRVMDNRPYDPGTPVPDPHKGSFVSDYGTMEFNGDGKTVVFDFDEKLASLTGLPQGKQEGEYVFLSGDLPPHGSVDVRYDVAHELEISTGDTRVVLRVGLAAEDGSTGSVGVGMVTEDRIPLLFHEDTYFSVIFEKK